MKFKKRLVLTLLSLALQTPLYAEGTIKVTIINHSNRAFAFNNLTVNHPNTTFTIDKDDLSPGETANVIGTVTANYDLEGTLYFNDNARFHIKDFRRYHWGQSQFTMFANYINSTVISKTPNPTRGPTQLMYVAATVLVESIMRRLD